MLIAFSMVTHAAVVALGWTAKATDPLHHALATLSIQLLPALLGYAILVRLIEQRPLRELSPRTLPTYGVAGFITGAVLFSVVVGVLWLVGSYHVTGMDPQVDWLPGVLVTGIGAGIGEEIITRGVLFRIVEEGLGTWWALAISVFRCRTHLQSRRHAVELRGNRDRGGSAIGHAVSRHPLTMGMHRPPCFMEHHAGHGLRHSGFRWRQQRLADLQPHRARLAERRRVRRGGFGSRACGLFVAHAGVADGCAAPRFRRAMQALATAAAAIQPPLIPLRSGRLWPDACTGYSVEDTITVPVIV
jgi:hypothetical protein